MNTHFKVPFQAARKLVQYAFPNAKSRRPVGVEAHESYHVASYWDGGSKTECVFVNIMTGAVLTADQVPMERQKAGNPFNLPIGDVSLQPHICVIEHVIFRGKDLGYRINVHPAVFSHFQHNMHQPGWELKAPDASALASLPSVASS